MSELVDAWPLLSGAIITSVVAGVLLGFLGVYVILRRMVFVSAALGQVAGLGVAAALWMQLPLLSPQLFSALATCAAAGLLLVNVGTSRVSRDAVLGACFLAGAAGTLMIGTRIAAELHDIESLLFGSGVAVLPGDLAIVTTTAVLIGALHLWWSRGFVQVSIDPDGAAVRGLPVRALNLALYLTLALTIAVCTRVIGALPVFALTVLPALAAIQLARNIPRALVLAAILGGVSGGLGYLLAFFADLPVGASQTTISIILVVIAIPLGRWLKI